ncbi:MAG: hypothetical protein IPK13_14875 [Deltaproteobacteria bacterium]|nr:hypothetical protein [Deltaproteobacteria bacterium]
MKLAPNGPPIATPPIGRSDVRGGPLNLGPAAPGAQAASSAPDASSASGPSNAPNPSSLAQVAGMIGRQVRRLWEKPERLVDLGAPPPLDASSELRSRLESALRTRLGGEPLIVTDACWGTLFGVKCDVLPEENPLVRDVPLRRDATDVRWVARLTGALPALGVSGEIGPVKGGARLSEAVRVWTIRPETSEILAPSNGSLAGLGVPFTAAEARMLRPGSEVVVLVNADAQRSLGLRFDPSGPMFSAGAALGANIEHGVAQELGIRCVRGAGDRVDVSLMRVDAGSSVAEALVGIQGTIGTGDVNSAIAMMDRAIMKRVAEFFALDAFADLGRFNQSKVVDKLTLDLSTPTGQEAYEAMLALDLRRARRLLRREIGRHDGTSVSAERLRADTHGTSRGAGVRFAGLELFRTRSTADETHGRYSWFSKSGLPLGFDGAEGTIASPRGRLEYVRASRTRRVGGLVLQAIGSGDVQHLQELLSVRPVASKGAEPGAMLYRRRFLVQRDLLPSRKDVEFVLDVARHFDLEGHEEAMKAVSDATDVGGCSHRVIDFMWTDAGIRRLFERTDAVDELFAESYQKWEHPTAGFGSWAEHAAPWLNREHPRYREMIELLERGNDPMALTRERYLEMTGRDLYADGHAYRSLRDLKRTLERLRDAPDQDPAKMLAELDRTDLSWTALFTLIKLAGRENTIVNEISLASSDKIIVDLYDPQALRMLRPPELLVPGQETSGTLEPAHLLALSAAAACSAKNAATPSAT